MPQSFNRLTGAGYLEVINRYCESGTTESYTITDGYFTRAESRSFSGEKIPNWKAFQKANGYLPTTDCADYYYLREAVAGYVSEGACYPGRSRVRDVRFHYAGGSAYTHSQEYKTALVNECWSKLRQKVLDQDFNAPIFLAEAGKTVNMITDTASRLYRAYRNFRRLNFPGVVHELGLTPGTVHNTWLAYKYGWMPLLMDIHGAAKTLATPGKNGNIQTIKTQVSSSANFARGSFPGNSLQASSVKRTSKAWVTFKVSNASLDSANRIGLLNPLLVAWELIPFSFVADWFINIGDCLQEATAFSGLTILAGGSSWKYEQTGSIQFPVSYLESQLGVSNFQEREYRRFKGVQVYPVLRVKSDPLNLSKLTTVAALFRQFR